MGTIPDETRLSEEGQSRQAALSLDVMRKWVREFQDGVDRDARSFRRRTTLMLLLVIVLVSAAGGYFMYHVRMQKLMLEDISVQFEKRLRESQSRVSSLDAELNSIAQRQSQSKSQLDIDLSSAVAKLSGAGEKAVASLIEVKAIQSRQAEYESSLKASSETSARLLKELEDDAKDWHTRSQSALTEFDASAKKLQKAIEEVTTEKLQRQEVPSKPEPGKTAEDGASPPSGEIQ